MSEEKLIYLDNAATTKIHPQVLEAMLPYFQEYYGNPSSIYDFGNQVKGALEEARKTVAGALGADPKEIYFTSGATEADNWAVFGAARKMASKGKHIITSTIEHHAVLHPFEVLEKEGFDVTYVPVDEEGILDLEALKSAVRDDTTFISVMAVNNEIGTIQPIREIAGIVKPYPGCRLHVDATQAVGKTDLWLDGVDTMSFTAHKFYGPNGIGALYKRRGLVIEPQISGGASTTIYRSGTPTLGLAVSLDAALTKALAGQDARNAHVQRLHDRLLAGLQQYSLVRVNSPAHAVPHIVNVSVTGVKGTRFQQALSEQGVCVSVKSACSSDGLPSKAVFAVSRDRRNALSSWRISISHLTTDAEIDGFLQAFDTCYKTLTNKEN